MFVHNRTVAIDKEGKVGTSSSGKFKLPQRFSEQIRQGKTLGEVAGEFSGDEDIHKEGGVVGLLTKQAVPRDMLALNSIAFALIEFINPELYGNH